MPCQLIIRQGRDNIKFYITPSSLEDYSCEKEVLENDKLIKYVGNLPVNDAFKTMDMLIAETIQGIAETITKPSLINLDFADLKAIMGEGGVAVMLAGETSKSENKPESVVEDALCHPLLEANYKGAKGALMLIHVTGGSDLTMKETQ